MEFRNAVCFCPRCGSGQFPEYAINAFRCEACEFHFHINNSIAVGAIITDAQERVLLIRRARDPGKGKFSIPGGFVDVNETAEAAVVREIREEVGLEVMDLQYLCSSPNPYSYRGVIFPVLDLVYICGVESFEPLQGEQDEVEEHVFLPPDQIDLDEIAFPSIREALAQYRHQRAA